MSLNALFENMSMAKSMGYTLAAGGTALALFDTFRLMSGDLSASASLAQNFLTNAAAVTGGLSFAMQASQDEDAIPAVVVCEQSHNNQNLE